MSDQVKPKRRDLTLPLKRTEVASELPAEAPQTPQGGAQALPPQASFDNVRMAASEVDRLQSNQRPEPPRRKRATGRNIPWTIKLRQDTLDYIYEQSNNRDVPLAQVIEEAIEAHRLTRSQ